LQFGSCNSDDPSALLAETNVKCIVVSPGYRLGIFGFLSSQELCGPSGANYGFWDQRLALEWTYENIEYFGGDKNNIIVGGLSAGSYATFHQLAYDIGPNSNRQIIRRVIQWSNGCGVQPKRLPEAQQQFNDLLSVLKIPLSWDKKQKLDALLGKSAEELVTAVDQMKQKFFRPILDGEFMSEDLFQQIYSGKFGQRMRDLGIQTIIGDLTQEFHLYSNSYPPRSYEDLVDRLSWDYPRRIATAICFPYKPFKSMPLRSEEDWKNIFGKLYADMQIHSTMRGFLRCIGTTLPLSHIHRYRIDWRTESVDKRLPREFGATHGTDMSIWFFGNGDSLTSSEKVVIKKWLEPLGAFISGGVVDWGTRSLEEVRYLSASGEIEVREDEWWESKLPLWNVTREVTNTRATTATARL
jgi:carboxylesterase type B